MFKLFAATVKTAVFPFLPDLQTAVAGFVASEFWLNALDESYVDENGAPIYKKEKITLENVRDCLKNMAPRVELSEEILREAVKPIEAMLARS